MNAAVFDRVFASLPDAMKSEKFDLAIVLGSGWGDALRPDRVLARVSYADLPGMGAATVAGHSGELLAYEAKGRKVLAFCGRRHWYEGVGWEPVVMAVEIARRLGIGTLLLTNASGGINPALRAGDFVIIKDHINTVGLNPLVGDRNPAWGVRFPDMTEVYTKPLRDVLHDAAVRLGLRIMEGVYAFTGGPVYETPAEVTAYKNWGADIVGMSTVPEAVFARACGIRVAGLSLVTNMAAGIARKPLSHEEVMAASVAAKPVMAELIGAFCAACG